MSIVNELPEAERARQKMAKLRLSLARASEAPKVENLLPAIEGDDIDKLQSARQGQDCNVIFSNIELPPGSRPNEVDIVLTKDKIPVSDWETLPSPVPAGFTMVLPKLQTATPGPFNLGFKTLYGSQETDSPESTFFIDTVAPNHGAPGAEADLPVEIINGLVTKEYLEAEGKVVMAIATPTDVAAGDIIRGYYGKSIPGAEIGTFNVDEDFSRPIIINIDKGVIERGSEGQNIFYFRYEDRVGNVGQLSAQTEMIIQLTPAPSSLQPPLVPLADDDLIDREDAIPSVGVVIPTFDNGLSGDQVRVIWGGRPQALIPTDGTAEVIVEVPFSEVAIGGDVQTNVLVSYEIDRQGATFPEPVGFMVASVNLEMPGPVDPLPNPEIGNPRLPPVVVQGSSTSDPDKLLVGDIGEPATVSVAIYDERKLGDLVRLYWDKVPVPGADGLYTVIGNEAVGQLMTFEIPSSIFEATKNGIKEVHYVITNPANGSNGNPSLRKDVDVYIFPVTLPAPRLQHLFTSNSGRVSLACTSLRDVPVEGKAAIVKVLGGEPLAEGMELSFTWKGTAFGSTPTPVPDYPFTKTLTGTEHMTGFEVYLPFNGALKPIKDGEGEIMYTVKIDGRDESSLGHKERVIMIDFDQNYCPGT